MTYKTGQISVCPSIRDRWADVDEIWRVYSMCLGTQLLGNQIFEYRPLLHTAYFELGPVGEMTHPDDGAYLFLMDDNNIDTVAGITCLLTVTVS